MTVELFAVQSVLSAFLQNYFYNGGLRVKGFLGCRGIIFCSTASGHWAKLEAGSSGVAVSTSQKNPTFIWVDKLARLLKTSPLVQSAVGSRDPCLPGRTGPLRVLQPSCTREKETAWEKMATKNGDRISTAVEAAVGSTLTNNDLSTHFHIYLVHQQYSQAASAPFSPVNIRFFWTIPKVL